MSTINITPSGKTIYQYPVDHYNDNTDPHGSTLTQTDIIVQSVLSGNNALCQNALCSGVGVFNRFIYNDINGNILQFNNLSEFRAYLTTLVLSGVAIDVYGVSNWVSDVNMDSGLSFDNNDITLRGVQLDSHLTNYNNPHLVTVDQISGIDKYTGGTLYGDLAVESGIGIDGVDVSLMKQMQDNSMIPSSSHYHHRSFKLTGLKQFMAPEYENSVYSGTDFVKFGGDWNLNHNCLMFSGTETEHMANVIIGVPLSTHFSQINSVAVNYKPIPTSAAPEASIDITIRDSNGDICSQTGGRNLTGNVGGPWQTATINGITGTFTPNTCITLEGTMKTFSGSGVMLGEIIMDFDESQRT